MVHYLDDFLFIGPADTEDCLRLVELFSGLCGQFGVPLAPEKTV